MKTFKWRKIKALKHDIDCTLNSFNSIESIDIMIKILMVDITCYKLINNPCKEIRDFYELQTL
jgi:hypothetical protein